MRGIAEGRAIGGGMHVRNIRADGEMNRHGNAVLVGRDEDAGIRVLDVKDAAVQKLPRGFAVADANTVRQLGDFVDVFSGFFRHAELAFAEAGFDVLGSVAGEGDFEIVNERGAVHRDSGDESALHQIDQNRAEADFDDVAADAPENGSALFARGGGWRREVREDLPRREYSEANREIL